MQIEDFFKTYKASKRLKEHSYQVEKLSLELFEQLKKIIMHKNIDFKNARKILSCAALLHDIAIGLEKFETKPHNKLASKIILENKINSLNEKENKIVALGARYHRGATPKAHKHKLYASLDEDTKQKVWVIGSILRLADALDENHISIVENIELNLEQDGTITVSTGLNHEFNKDLEKTFEKKKDMFEEFFKIKIYLKKD